MTKPEDLKKLLKYEPHTGKLYWLSRPIEMFSSEVSAKLWNAKHAKKEAFYTLSDNGYLMGRINNKLFKTHRVIWALVTGYWPLDQIDHLDGNRTNNVWTNLREATRQENNRNRSKNLTSSSLYKGVSKHSDGKWQVRCYVSGKNSYHGLFTCEVEAAKKYDEIATQSFGEFAKLNFR